MKKISDMAKSYSPVAEQAQEPINNAAVQVINKVFQELQAIYPAWRQAFPDAGTVSLAKKIWIKTFAEKNITSIEQVKRGMAKARGDTSDFIPSAGKFCSWCLEQVDPDESFRKFIGREEMKTPAEKLTAKQVGYNCRRMPEEKALRLWAKTLASNLERQNRGELDKPERKMITNATVRNPIDDIRTNTEIKTASARALMDRINRIKK